MNFEIKSRIKLHDTDAAGVVFFVSHFRIAHTAYEEFLESIGCGLDMIIGKADYLVLIAHAEADYHRPFRLGDDIVISVQATKIKRVSFELTTTIRDAQREVGATVRTVHVAIDKASHRKIALPEELRAGLESIS